MGQNIPKWNRELAIRLKKIYPSPDVLSATTPALLSITFDGLTEFVQNSGV